MIFEGEEIFFNKFVQLFKKKDSKKCRAGMAAGPIHRQTWMLADKDDIVKDKDDIIKNLSVLGGTVEFVLPHFIFY